MSSPIIFSIDTETGDYKFLLSDETCTFLDPSSNVRRASHVEPVNLILRIMFYAIRLFGEDGRMGNWTRGWSCRWRVNLSPIGGIVIPVDFASRNSAISFEIDYLNNHFL